MIRALHHLDLWVSNPGPAIAEWEWLLGELGWEMAADSGDNSASWAHEDGTYFFLERSPDLVDEALTVADRPTLDRLRAESSGHGWHELYADRYPHAGGEQHTALFLESSEGFEVEVVVAG
jgi:hypothetical protein